MKSIAVIIHARVQSTRCTNKHLRSIGGNTTLIDIAVENLNKLTGIEEKYLAVHEEELASKAKGDVQVLYRDFDAVAPGNPTHDIMYRHLKDVKADYIINYNPCQPFLNVEKLQKVIDWYKQTGYESAITVKETRNFYWNTLNHSPINFKSNDRLSTTAGPSVLTATHSLVMYKKSYMLENWELFPNEIMKPYPFVIDWPEEELVDVDTELDFKLVKLLYSERNKYTLDSWRKEQSKHDTDVHSDTKVLAIDFDGVIHKNSKGFHNGEVYDTPVEGAIDAIKILAKNYKLILYTFKGHPDRPLIRGLNGIELTWEWLKKYEIDQYFDDIVWGKPNAKVYIDDKGYRFQSWADTLKYIDENI